MSTKKVPCTAAAAGAPWTSFVLAVDEVARTPPGRILSGYLHTGIRFGLCCAELQLQLTHTRSRLLQAPLNGSREFRVSRRHLLQLGVGVTQPPLRRAPAQAPPHIHTPKLATHPRAPWSDHTKQPTLMEETTRVALVVGAGDGLGAAIARRFAAEGLLVCVVRRNGAKLAPLVSQVGAPNTISPKP